MPLPVHKRVPTVWNGNTCICRAPHRVYLSKHVLGRVPALEHSSLNMCAKSSATNGLWVEGFSGGNGLFTMSA